MGLEPIRDCSHQPLKLACLPFHHNGIHYLSHGILSYRSYGESPVAIFSNPPGTIFHSVCFFFSLFWLIWNSCPHFVVQCTPNPFSEDGIFRTNLCLLPAFSVKDFLGTNISLSSWWCRRGLNPQTPAWKAGNSTNSSTAPFGTPNGTRTRITGLRGQPPIPVRGWEHFCTKPNQHLMIVGWGSWTRTSECRSQSPVPYHLAIPQYFLIRCCILYQSMV